MTILIKSETRVSLAIMIRIMADLMEETSEVNVDKAMFIPKQRWYHLKWLFGLFTSLSILIALGGSPQFSERAIAAVLSNSEPLMEASIHLGNSAEELKFVPDHLEFIAGRRYKLTLDNPSSQKHYFTAKDFADAIWTQKVEAGNVEVKGAVHELELKPGAIAEWVFVPLKSGTYELHCSIPGHSEAGMRGVLTVATQQPA